MRQAAAIVMALCIGHVALDAQERVFTVNAPAEVHRGPSTGSPVVGTARRGLVLPVTRELGSWVSVEWPGTAEGQGFVHVSRGSLGTASGTANPGRAVTTPAPTDSERTARAEVRAIDERLEFRAAAAASTSSTGTGRGAAAPMQLYSTPTHVFGVGALLVGRTFAAFAASGRAWRGRVGAQLRLARTSYVSGIAQERLSSTQFEPSVLFALPGRVTDYVWMRPYAGSGLSIERRTVRSTFGGPAAQAGTGLGTQLFGGAELTFAAMPRLAASADLGYRWVRTPPAGFDIGGAVFTMSAHWYLK